MKILVALSAVLACSLAEPTYTYSSLGYAGGIVAPGLLAPGIAYPGVIAPTLAARSYLGHIGAPVAVAPAAVAAPVVEARAALPAIAPAVAGAPVVAAPAFAGAPVVAAPALGGVPVVAAPALAATPVVAAKAAIPAVAAAPVVAVAAAPVTKTQYHSQDEFGNAAFGHAEPGQVHSSVQDAHGNRVGSFSYLNPTDGQVHRTDYVADGLGYRVAANDLPIGPAAPIADTPEVAAAKAAHLAAKEEAHRTRRSILTTPAATAPLVAHLAYAAPAFHAPLAAPAFAAPLPYAAHLGLPATLTTIVNNPGHAVSYRID